MTALDLSGFTGTSQYVRWSPLFKDVLTEGTHHVAEEFGAYWLFDLIASHLMGIKAKGEGEGFVTANLTVLRRDGVHKATVVMTDGNDNQLAKQDIDYTDFPAGEIRFFAVFDHTLNGYVIMLPTEY